MAGPAGSRDQLPRGTRAPEDDRIRRNARSPQRARESRAFLLTKTYMDGGYTAIWITKAPTLGREGDDCERCYEGKQQTRTFQHSQLLVPQAGQVQTVTRKHR